jgi:hypothetical protein
MANLNTPTPYTPVEYLVAVTHSPAPLCHAGVRR